MEKPGPIRTCVDSKYTNTGSRSNLTSSIASTNQLFIRSLSSSQNRQKPLQIMEKLESIRTYVDSKSTIADFRLRLTKSTWNQQRLTCNRHRYKLIQGFFRYFWWLLVVFGDFEEQGRQLDEQMINAIDRARRV